MTRKSVGFSHALEDSLNAIGDGQSIGDCLARHPAHAETLRPYLETVIQMRQSSESERRIPFEIPVDISFNVALNHSIQMIMRGKTPEHCYVQYPEHAAQLKSWLDAIVDIRQNGGAGSVKEVLFPSDLLAPQVSFSEALEYCLDALARGMQPDAALSRYPYYADRLRIWVYFIASLRLRLDLGLHPVRTQAKKHAIQTALTRVRGYSRPIYNAAFSILLAFFTLSGITGFARAANESLPGDALYPFKQTMRQVQIGLASPLEQPHLIALIERERRFEVAALIETNKEQVVEFTGQVVAVDQDGVVIEDVGKVFISLGQKPPSLQAGVFVFVRGSTTRSGVSAKNIDMVSPPGAGSTPPTVTQGASLPSATLMPPPTNTATRWFSPTPTLRLFTPTWTNSPIPPPTETSSPSPTNTPTSAFTFTPTSSLTASPTTTDTSTPSPTDTPTPPPTDTPTLPPTDTPTPPPTDTPTPPPTDTPTPRPTDTPTPPPTDTPASSPTPGSEVFP